MAVAGYAHGIQTSFLATMNARAIAARQARAADPIQTVSVTPAATAAAKTAQAAPDGSSFFDNVLDVINPLQHLPVVGTLYRAVTGDKIGDAAQVAGDTLYGGVIGLGASLANLVFKDATGKDFGDTVLAFAEDATGLHLGDNHPAALADAKPPGREAGSTKPMMAMNAAARPQTAVQVHPGPGRMQALPTKGVEGQVKASEVIGTPLESVAFKRNPDQRAAQAAPANTPPATPASVVPAQATVLNDPAGFMAALKAKGIDPTIGMRAMRAYEKTLGLNQR